MTTPIKLNELVAENPIPDRYRQIIHTFNLTCTFSCTIGKSLKGSAEITSSNVNPNGFLPEERAAIIRGDHDVVIHRETATFIYRLVHKTSRARIYRVASHSADFTRGMY